MRTPLTVLTAINFVLCVVLVVMMGAVLQHAPGGTPEPSDLATSEQLAATARRVETICQAVEKSRNISKDAEAMVRDLQDGLPGMHWETQAYVLMMSQELALAIGYRCDGDGDW